MRKDVRTGLLIGAAISIGVAGVLLTKENLGVGIAEPSTSQVQSDNFDGRFRDNAMPAVSSAQQPVPLPPPAVAPAAKPVSNQPEKPIVLTPIKTTRFHIIRPGETLSSIAKKYYGSTSAAGRIFEANKGTIQNPNQIRPGTKIIIPDQVP